MTDFHIRDDCRLCSGPLELVLDLGETALANEVWDDPKKPQDKFPLRLVQCRECGHMQNPVVVSPERLFRHYSYTSGLTESYREHLRKYGFDVVPYLDPGEMLVEIGGNDGTFGAVVEEFGNDRNYLNIDPSDVEQLHGARITEFFSSAVAKRIRGDFGPAKVIVANHVFAHVDDLHDMAEGVRELLADDGTFFCEVGHGPTQLNSGCLDVIYHEHLSFHDQGSFRRFWQGHGFKLRALELNGAQGGSMRCELVKGTPGRLNQLEHFDIPRIQAAAKHLRGLGALLERATDNADRLGIYGAPAKLTTLMALIKPRYSSLYNWVVFDDSPRKIGKRTPGDHMEIFPPVLERSNDWTLNDCEFTLIASWNFADEIIARWPDYRGTWIVPLPEVRFIPGGGA